MVAAVLTVISSQPPLSLILSIEFKPFRSRTTAKIRRYPFAVYFVKETLGFLKIM